jgi:hypothetical protein
VNYERRGIRISNLDDILSNNLEHIKLTSEGNNHPQPEGTGWEHYKHSFMPLAGWKTLWQKSV